MTTVNYFNTKQNYGRIARWLHWGTALLFLLAIQSLQSAGKNGDAAGRAQTVAGPFLAEAPPPVIELPATGTVSAPASDDESQAAADGRFAATIVKPIREMQLAGCVRSLLGPEQEDPLEIAATSTVCDTAAHTRVLLAEDNPINRQVSLHQLTNLGYEADVASNGREALLALETTPYDLVLMDVDMPIMDGLTATRGIRQQERATGTHTPIVALTSSARCEQCLAAGMDAFLSKPLQIDALRDILDAVVTSAAA